MLAREPPYAFNNSANPLEDVLGLTAALVVSRIDSSTVTISGTSLITAMRIGSGDLYALGFLIPPAAAAVILAYLMIVTRSLKCSSLSTSSMSDLIQLGRILASDPAKKSLTEDEDEYHSDQ